MSSDRAAGEEKQPGHRASSGRAFLIGDQALECSTAEHRVGPIAQFQAAQMFLSSQAMVIVDDCHPHGGNPMGKGTELIPWAEAEGMKVEIRSTFAEYRAAIINPRGQRAVDNPRGETFER